jgi:predicted 2-oxoglutarate/Fe(II)-dependent dioxygenase YbiX
VLEQELLAVLGDDRHLVGRLSQRVRVALDALGGLPVLSRTVISQHEHLRAQHAGSVAPAALQHRLGEQAAAVAVLRKALTSTLTQLQFHASGTQDGQLLRSSELADDVACGPDVALDSRAVEALCAQRCVTRRDFLCAADAAALLAEMLALDSDEEAPAGVRRRVGAAASAWGGGSVFRRSQGAAINQASGRRFFNVSAAEARRFGAPVLARTLDALAALVRPLSGAASAWWRGDVLAPTRGMIQLYPPGAEYGVHTDAQHVGDGWLTTRAFTALVYAHPGWQPGLGGELSVWPAGAGGPTTVEPRGGTLALFPAHLEHSVAPVVGSKRYCVTMWLSLAERALPAGGDAAALAAERTAPQWLELLSRYSAAVLWPPPAGTVCANAAHAGATRERQRRALARTYEDTIEASAAEKT